MYTIYLRDPDDKLVVEEYRSLEAANYAADFLIARGYRLLAIDKPLD
jgi:hypothetical protein